MMSSQNGTGATIVKSLLAYDVIFYDLIALNKGQCLFTRLAHGIRQMQDNRRESKIICACENTINM